VLCFSRIVKKQAMSWVIKIEIMTVECRVSVCCQIFFYSTGIYSHAGVPQFAIEFAVVGTCAVNVFMTVVAVRNQH